ncbi:MAG: type II toxin-antitoxin system RelE/ParE family toxin [candidate division Zixibacteria bacterium]|nr:type II toxin-antitoxin system RelE/ParE family toxin [Candidatus Tariuqbacter arcticus]
MYEVLISHEAEKQYRKLDRNTKRRINNSITNISKEPLTSRHTKKLWGKLEGNYRYAIGDIRIVYEADNKNKIVKIKAIKSRGDVYK